jgi:flagellum-specific peptidoglycan hydrolase FlgJ
MNKFLILVLIFLPFKTLLCQTKQEVRSYIIECDIQHPDIVYAQYGLESGWGKSKAAINRCNLFGFTTKKGIIEFESQYDSVLYYKKWQTKRYKGGNYYQFLENIKYASDSLYIDRLKQIVKSL